MFVTSMKLKKYTVCDLQWCCHKDRKIEQQALHLPQHHGIQITAYSHRGFLYRHLNFTLNHVIGMVILIKPTHCSFYEETG